MLTNGTTLSLLMLSFFLCHERNAIRHHEWRLFAFLNRLGGNTAYEIWHEDETFTICWPVRAFVATAV